MLPITRKSKRQTSRQTRKSASNNKKRATTRRGKAHKKGGACPLMKAGSVQRGG